MLLGLRKDCKLCVECDRTYVAMHGYEIDLSWQMAFLLSLMNGSRSQDLVVELAVKVRLVSESQKEEVLTRFKKECSVFLEKYSLGEVRTDIPHPKCFLKPKQNYIKPYDNILPRAALFHATSKCDKMCVYCYMNPHRIEDDDVLTLEEIYGIIDQFRKIGLSNIVFTGGEPFMHECFLDILQYTTDRGISATVTTKHYFTKEEVMLIRKMQIVEISLSYDCHIDSISEFMSGGNPTHRASMEDSLRLLIDSNVQVSVNVVVTAVNINVIKSFFSYLYSMGVKNVEIHEYHPNERSNDEHLRVTREQMDEVRNIMNETKHMNLSVRCDLNELYSKRAKPNDYTQMGCVNGLLNISIMPNGKVVLCEHIAEVESCCYGDLKVESVESVWFGCRRQQLINPCRTLYRNMYCENCEDFGSCIVKVACRKLSYEERGDAMQASSLTLKLCAKLNEGTQQPCLNH